MIEYKDVDKNMFSIVNYQKFTMIYTRAKSVKADPF